MQTTKLYATSHTKSTRSVFGCVHNVHLKPSPVAFKLEKSFTSPLNMQGYGSYPYYNQHPAYSQAHAQTPYMGGGSAAAYMPFYAQNNTPFVPPAPIPFDSHKKNSWMAPASSTNPRTKPGKVSAPLRSAMKRSQAVPPSDMRQRTNSQNQQTNALTRMPSNPVQNANLLPNSLPGYHIFVSFQGDSDLVLENVPEPARDELQKMIKEMWTPGVEYEDYRGYLWRVRLKSQPWNMGGSAASLTWPMIVRMFTLFAQRGYSFQTSINSTTSRPRLIFAATAMDPGASFFLGYFSKRGHQVTLIDPPMKILTSFEMVLKQVSPYYILDYHRSEGNLHSIHAKKGSSEVEPSHFLMLVLRAMSDLGYTLNTTVAMARGGLLRLGSRRELFVFRNIPT